MKHLAIREDIIATCKRMNASGLNIGSAGNLSVRITGGLLVTPSGIAYDAMRPEQIVELDEERKCGDVSDLLVVLCGDRG